MTDQQHARSDFPRSGASAASRSTSMSTDEPSPVQRQFRVDSKTARVRCATCETYWSARAAVIAAEILALTGGGVPALRLAMRFTAGVHRRHAIYLLPLDYPGSE